MNSADFLLQLDLFRELPADLRGVVSELFLEQEFDDDEIVFRAGDPATDLFVVRSGAVSLAITTVFRPRLSHHRAVSNMSVWGAPPAYLVTTTPSAFRFHRASWAATMQLRFRSSSWLEEVVAMAPARVISPA